MVCASLKTSSHVAASVSHVWHRSSSYMHKGNLRWRFSGTSPATGQ